MTLHVRCPGYLGAREQTGPVSNREEQQRSGIHRRELPGQQDERKGMYGPHILLIVLSPGGGEIPGRHLVGRLLQGWDSPWLLPLL